MGGAQVVSIALQEDLSVLHEERIVDEVLDVGDEVGWRCSVFQRLATAWRDSSV